MELRARSPILHGQRLTAILDPLDPDRIIVGAPGGALVGSLTLHAALITYEVIPDTLVEWVALNWTRQADTSRLAPWAGGPEANN